MCFVTRRRELTRGSSGLDTGACNFIARTCPGFCSRPLGRRVRGRRPRPKSTGFGGVRALRDMCMTRTLKSGAAPRRRLRLLGCARRDIVRSTSASKLHGLKTTTQPSLRFQSARRKAASQRRRRRSCGSSSAWRPLLPGTRSLTS